MIRRVALVRTDGSEELSASIIRVTRIGGLGTLAVNSHRRTVRQNTVTLMMEGLSSSETSILTRATRCNIQEDAILQSSKYFAPLVNTTYLLVLLLFLVQQSKGVDAVALPTCTALITDVTRWHLVTGA
jgi:hypothetical protein